MDDLSETLIKRLTQERDEARKLYCLAYSGQDRVDAEEHAEELGWDCFKEIRNG